MGRIYTAIEVRQDESSHEESTWLQEQGKARLSVNESLGDTRDTSIVSKMGGNELSTIFKDDGYTCCFDYFILNAPMFVSF